MIIDELFESPQQCPECGGISFSDLILAEKKDACYHKVKASAKVWPSAYASGRLVQCRKKGAANYGNKSEGVAEAGFPGAPDVEMPPMNPSGDPQRDKLKQEYMDLHREIKSLVDLQYRSTSDEQKMQAKARIEQLNDRADQIKAILEPRQPPNEWQKKTYGFDDNWNKVNQGVAENTAPQLSVQQLATISDEALDNAYGYGRSTPGNTFGWQANLKSAAYAKQMIDQGVTDIEAISDAIHKGWNTTAQAFVQDPEQFDDTAKLAAAGKLEAKLQQRAQLMKQNYAQLPEEEKEKDRVVARALLQAIRGEQGVAEGYVPINISKMPTNPAPKPKKVEKDYTPKYDPQVHGPVYDLEWQRQQNEKRWYNVVRRSDGKVINPEPIKGQTAAEEFMKQNGLGGGNADLETISTIRFHVTGIDASGKRVVSEPLTDMKDVRNFYKQHGINQFASTTDVTTTDDGSVTEGQLESNTPDPVVVVQDLKGNILDKINLSVAAQKYKLGQPENIKKQLAHQNYTKVGNYTIVSPMSGQPQDQTTIGQKSTFATTEGEQQKGADYRDPKEVDYDDEYDAMVARVKKLAGLSPMKTTYDPAKRQYRNMPTAQQPKK
jgi:hypothetical protein